MVPCARRCKIRRARRLLMVCGTYRGRAAVRLEPNASGCGRHPSWPACARMTCRRSCAHSSSARPTGTSFGRSCEPSFGRSNEPTSSLPASPTWLPSGRTDPRSSWRLCEPTSSLSLWPTDWSTSCGVWLVTCWSPLPAGTAKALRNQRKTVTTREKEKGGFPRAVDPSTLSRTSPSPYNEARPSSLPPNACAAPPAAGLQTPTARLAVNRHITCTSGRLVQAVSRQNSSRMACISSCSLLLTASTPPLSGPKP